VKAILRLILNIKNDEVFLDISFSQRLSGNRLCAGRQIEYTDARRHHRKRDEGNRETNGIPVFL